ISFRETTVTTQELTDGVAAEFDAEGRLVGLEILDATKRLGDPSPFVRSFWRASARRRRDPTRPERPPAMSETLRRQVLQLYAEVDAEVAAAGPVCVASGRCCRFKEFGHVLFLSNLEADVLLSAAPPYDPAAVTPDFCPFQQGNLCTARGPRPLGCRVYYCDPNYQETAHALTEKSLRTLKALAEEAGAGWRYAPLHHFLRRPEEAGADP